MATIKQMQSTDRNMCHRCKTINKTSNVSADIPKALLGLSETCKQ